MYLSQSSSLTGLIQATLLLILIPAAACSEMVHIISPKPYDVIETSGEAGTSAKLQVMFELSDGKISALCGPDGAYLSLSIHHKNGNSPFQQLGRVQSPAVLSLMPVGTHVLKATLW